MSGARRRGLISRALRGGGIGRRIRVKALLLCSSRSDPGAFRDWLHTEMIKAVVPMVPVAVAGFLGRPLPSFLSAGLVAVGASWVVFVLFHASIAAFRMNSRHAAYMRAIGIDLSAAATLGNPKLWRRVGTTMTMREALAEMKACQTVS